MLSLSGYTWGSNSQIPDNRYMTLVLMRGQERFRLPDFVVYFQMYSYRISYLLINSVWIMLIIGCFTEETILLNVLHSLFAYLRFIRVVFLLSHVFKLF